MGRLIVAAKGLNLIFSGVLATNTQRQKPDKVLINEVSFRKRRYGKRRGSEIQNIIMPFPLSIDLVGHSAASLVDEGFFRFLRLEQQCRT